MNDLTLKIIMKLPYSYFHKFIEAISHNKEWANRLNLEHRNVDIIHDINGLLSKDEHFCSRL